MTTIRFSIPGRPITKKNSQVICVNKKTGRIFITQSKQYKEYERASGYFIPVKREMIETPVNIKCLYFMPTRGKVDLTNLLEATDDILVHYGVIKDDHSGILASHDGSRVLYDKNNPRVEVEIEEATTWPNIITGGATSAI